REYRSEKACITYCEGVPRNLYAVPTGLVPRSHNVSTDMPPLVGPVGAEMRPTLNHKLSFLAIISTRSLPWSGKKCYRYGNIFVYRIPPGNCIYSMVWYP